jgi:hypothetical protein
MCGLFASVCACVLFAGDCVSVVGFLCGLVDVASLVAALPAASALTAPVLLLCCALLVLAVGVLLALLLLLCACGVLVLAFWLAGAWFCVSRCPCCGSCADAGVDAAMCVWCVCVYVCAVYYKWMFWVWCSFLYVDVAGVCVWVYVSVWTEIFGCEILNGIYGLTLHVHVFIRMVWRYIYV